MNKKIIDTMFEYEGRGCSCIKEVEHLVPGETPKCTLKACADNTKKLHFSYAARSGLNLTGPGGGIIDDNILGRLLSIKNNNVDDCVDFFNNYGFLVPLKSDQYITADGSEINNIVNHLKASIKLMNSISKKDYKGILENTVFLLYSPVTCLKAGDEIIYKTCGHDFTKILSSNPIFPDISDDREVFLCGTFSVNDTYLNKTNHIDAEFYNSIRSNSKTSVPGSRQSGYRRLVAMYVGCQDVNIETRKVIDFLYHFQTEISVFKDIDFGKTTFYSKWNQENLSDEMKRILIEVGKIVLSEEINFNISGIHPKYETGTTVPSWEIPTLIEALFFSVFYMKSGYVYKECENPNCKHGHYFLIEATRTNKKYCCAQCANAAAAQRHRMKTLSEK